MLHIGQTEHSSTQWLSGMGWGSQSWKKWDHEQRGNSQGAGMPLNQIALTNAFPFWEKKIFFTFLPEAPAKQDMKRGWAWLFSVAKARHHLLRDSVSMVSMWTLIPVLGHCWGSFLKSERNVKRKKEAGNKCNFQIPKNSIKYFFSSLSLFFFF